MKSRLYLCIKNPLAERDVERFGVAELGELYDLRILDCTAWLMPSALHTRGGDNLSFPNLRCIATLAEFKAELETGGFALDYVGPFSPQAILMFEALRQRRIRLVVVDSGAYPPPDVVLSQRSVFRKISDAMRYGGMRAHLAALINKTLLRLLPDQRPDLALVSGNWWRSDPRFSEARCHVQAHSFDYEFFRKMSQSSDICVGLSDNDYAVYLDENIAGHEDNADLGFASPASDEAFYPALNRWFECYEKTSGLKVVVAGYPSCRRETRDRFAGRTVIYGKTAELVRHSRAVFAHASTAISFAVLWKRPLIFLTSIEVEASWYAPWIRAPQSLLKAPLINIDHEWQPLPSERIDDGAYNAYKHTFIKAAESQDKSLWEILAGAINQADADKVLVEQIKR
jgi:hypothetical protein